MSKILLEPKIIKVAIVDDQDDIRDNLASLIDEIIDLDCSHCYKSAEEGLQFLPLLQPDIVLLDLHFPYMKGLELLKRVKVMCPDTTFLIFTVFEDDDHVFEALKAGARGYLTKKASTKKIIESIREAYDGGSPMSPEIARKVLDYISGYQRQFDNSKSKLARRELEILEHLAQGMTYREIGETLAIAKSTVKQYINVIYRKLQVLNRFEAIKKYLGRP